MKDLALALVLLAAACGGGSSTAATTPGATAAVAQPTAFSVKVSGSGRPVIFIPGYACPGSVWDATVAHLGGKVQSHVLTLAGFAGEPPLAGATEFLPVVRAQLIQYIHDRKLERPIIVGHSMGGFLALWIASTNSADLGGVVDVDAVPFFAAILDPSANEAKAAEMATPMSDRIAAATPEQFAAQSRAFLTPMVTDPAAAERIAVAAGRSDVATAAMAMREMMTKDLRPGLANIRTKVTVIAATNVGPDVPRTALEAGWHTQVDPIAGVELHFVEGSKHFVMLDQPAAFHALLDRALAAK